MIKYAHFKYSDILEHPEWLYRGSIVHNDETDCWYAVVNTNPIVLQSIDLREEKPKENHVGDYMLNLNSGLMSVYTGKDRVGALSMNFAVGDQVMNQIRLLAGVR